MNQMLKRLLFQLIGKEPDAVVVTFLSGSPELAEQMAAQMKRLAPDRRHFFVRLPGEPPVEGGETIYAGSESAWLVFAQLRRVLAGYRVGLAPALFDVSPERAVLRRAAFLLAPGRVLAWNSRLERHHLRLRTWIASSLFLRGVPLDRIFLRPRRLVPLRRDRTFVPQQVREVAGRPLSPARPRIAVLTPYFPYPLSHGGAVRMFALLKEAAKQFDIFLFSFLDRETEQDLEPVKEFCVRLVLAGKPRYREPRWSSLAPPEVCEFRSPPMRQALRRIRSEYSIPVLQVEYTQLAEYGGDILVEHDITFDLFEQVWREHPSLAAWWDWWRWRRFEKRALRRVPRVVVMSEKDVMLANNELPPQQASKVRVIPNGVDLARFTPRTEPDGKRLLFVGSFRHFPNIVAYRFFTEEIWPSVKRAIPEARLTAVGGPDHLLYWHSGVCAPNAQNHNEKSPWNEVCFYVLPVVPMADESSAVSGGGGGGILEAVPETPDLPEGSEALEGGEQQRTGLSPRHQRVATLLTQLASTARSFLLYDARNAAIQRFISTLLEGLLSTLRAERAIDLDVQPFELRFDGQAVYVNQDRERSLAFRLYRDGVRSLRFRDGFDWDELAKLLEIFSIRYTGVHQQEDDVVTLLWKANFKHLDIGAVEGFIPEDTDDDEADSAEEAVSPLPADLDLPMPPLRRPAEPTWAPVEEETREALRNEASAVALPDDCLLLLRQLRPLLDDPKERVPLAELSHLYSEIRDFLLSDENLGSLARLSGLLGDLAKGESPEWDRGRAALAQELLRSCGDARAVQRLLHSVPAEERAPRPELLDILDGACGDPLGAVIAAHAVESGAGSRAVARHLLVRYATGKLDILHRAFEKARGHVALDLIQVIAQAGGESEAAFCAHQTTHPDAEVRGEALRCLEGMPYSGSTGRALFEAFRRVSAEERPRVLALMERSRDRRFVEHLAAFVEKEAGRMAVEEAMAIGRAMGHLGGPASLASWQAWLRPAGLLRKGLQGPLALQVAAAAALGEIPGELASQALRTALAAAGSGSDAERWIGQILAQQRRNSTGRAAS